MEGFNLILREEREQVVEYGRKLMEANLTTGTGGNLSVFNREEGYIALSPSGMDYFDVKPEDVVIMTLDGDFVEEDHLVPTTEWGLHLGIYRVRPDASAIVHCHSDYATAVSCLGIDLPAVNYMVAVAGDKVPITPFAVYGTPELAKNVADNIGDYNAVLMANHGQIALGRSMKAAFTVALNVEYVARLYILAKSAGEPVILPKEAIEGTQRQFASYGQTKRR